MEKLSSGYRINRAADDAAGLAISEKMRGQIGGLAQAQRNAQDGISLVQTAEGALTEVHSMLQRVRDLKVQFNNGTLSTDDQDAIAAEVSQIAPGDQGHHRPDTKFNGTAVFGSGDVHFQVGANDAETIATTAPTSRRHRHRRHGRPRRAHRRLDAAHAATASTSGGTPRRSSTIDGAIKNVSTARAELRRGAEPPRASPEQPGDLPGEPDRVRVAHPRRGHGGRDDEVHEAQHPAAGRHEHARAGQPGARRASCRCSASAHRLERADATLQGRPSAADLGV